eukprot:c7420_g1_i2.p1 GENE.c7420_g1_i2~~c7420_g1_i2.p1  ORF type:complete len:618 (+),score=129.06 c7420_g1_i2:205-2058(+)
MKHAFSFEHVELEDTRHLKCFEGMIVSAPVLSEEFDNFQSFVKRFKKRPKAKTCGPLDIGSMPLSLRGIFEPSPQQPEQPSEPVQSQKPDEEVPPIQQDPEPTDEPEPTKIPELQDLDSDLELSNSPYIPHSEPVDLSNEPFVVQPLSSSPSLSPKEPSFSPTFPRSQGRKLSPSPTRAGSRSPTKSGSPSSTRSMTLPASAFTAALSETPPSPTARPRVGSRPHLSIRNPTSAPTPTTTPAPRTPRSIAAPKHSLSSLNINSTTSSTTAGSGVQRPRSNSINSTTNLNLPGSNSATTTSKTPTKAPTRQPSDVASRSRIAPSTPQPTKKTLPAEVTSLPAKPRTMSLGRSLGSLVRSQLTKNSAVVQSPSPATSSTTAPGTTATPTPPSPSALRSRPSSSFGHVSRSQASKQTINSSSSTPRSLPSSVSKPSLKSSKSEADPSTATAGQNENNPTKEKRSSSLPRSSLGTRILSAAATPPKAMYNTISRSLGRSAEKSLIKTPAAKSLSSYTLAKASAATATTPRTARKQMTGSFGRSTERALNKSVKQQGFSTIQSKASRVGPPNVTDIFPKENAQGTNDNSNETESQVLQQHQAEEKPGWVTNLFAADAAIEQP